MQNDQDNMLSTSLGNCKNKTIFDLIAHEINETVHGDRVLRKIEKAVINSETLKQLSFEQLTAYQDRVARRQEAAHRFLIDFYRVNSKSQSILAALEKYTVAGITGGNDIIPGMSASSLTREQEEAKKLITDRVRDIINAEMLED